MKIFLKIVLVIIVIIVVFVIGAAIYFGTYMQINKKELKPNEIILEGTNGKKALVLYQKTKHDTATNITMALANSLNKLGYTVIINHPSSELKYEMKDFSVLAFGSGVYMGGVSIPLTNYMEQTDMTGKQVIVYAVGENMEETAEVDLLMSKVQGTETKTGIKVKKGQEKKIADFVTEFISE